MKYIITISFLFFAFFCANAQIGKAKIVEKNGKNYYLHIVEKGQTAYGISKMYEVSVADVIDVNPTAKSGLQIGQELYIPAPQSKEVEPPVKMIEEKKDVKQVETTVGEVIQKEEKVDTNQIIHEVQQGETMYAIAKKYGINPVDLIAANGNNSNIKPGDKIIIPVQLADKSNVVVPIVKDPVNTSVNPGDSVVLHTVEKGETFYSLSKLYDVTGQDIRDANDGLPKGLQVGETIKVIVKKKGAIAPQQMNFTAVYDSTSRVENVYDIAIMLPYMLDENDKFRAKCPPVGDCPFYGYTVMSINFERGIMMAIDSLKNAGLNVKVHVFDTENDTATISKILAKPVMNNVDLIFGPLYPRQIKMVAEFSREHKIQNIIPVPVSNKALYNNPYLTKYVASTPTQVQKLGEFVAEKYGNANVIAIKNKSSESDGFYFDEFVKSFNENIATNPLKLNAEAKTTSMSTSSKFTAVEALLHDTALNVLVVPSEDVGHVSNLITKLVATTNSYKYSKYKYMIVGLEDWVNFETIDEKYKSRYNLNVVTAGFVDYNDPKVKAFIKTFRKKYGTDPDKYAFRGFDAAYTNLAGLLLYGTAYAPNYQLLKTDGYSSGSDYQTVEEGSGYENQAVYFLRYDDYTVRVIR